MAHFAKLDENNVVIQVLVVNNIYLLDDNGIEQEQLGISWLINWSRGHSNWKQTSYNNNFRKNYAGIGYRYDPDKDAFIPPKFFASWILNEDTCQWEPPIPKPGELYIWNEATETWVQNN